MTLALLSKRVRDIGLAPLPLLIGAIASLALDDTVPDSFHRFALLSLFARQTPLGCLLATGWFIFSISLAG